MARPDVFFPPQEGAVLVVYGWGERIACDNCCEQGRAEGRLALNYPREGRNAGNPCFLSRHA